MALYAAGGPIKNSPSSRPAFPEPSKKCKAELASLLIQLRIPAAAIASSSSIESLRFAKSSFVGSVICISPVDGADHPTTLSGAMEKFPGPKTRELHSIVSSRHLVRRAARGTAAEGKRDLDVRGEKARDRAAGCLDPMPGGLCFALEPATE